MMILGVNARVLGAHLAGWRHPKAWSRTVMNLGHMIEYAELAEQGKLHFMFLADGNGVRHMDKPGLFAATTPSDRPAAFEPVTLLSALAMKTQRLGLVATATTTYEEPFTLARKFASLDNLSGGRAAWNLITTANPGDAMNFSRTEHVARDMRYQRAAEFIEVVRGLWDSWADDAFPQDKESGQFLDPARVHTLNHKGKFFSVLGPLNVARSPQGRPLVFSAGQSEPGKELIARIADCMFATGNSKEASQAVYADIKGRMEKYGRRSDELKILPDMTVCVAESRSQASELYEELQQLISPELGVSFLSKQLDMDLSAYPIDGPVPDLGDMPVGGTSARTAIAEIAHKDGLSIRQTYQKTVGGAGGSIFMGTAVDVADQMQDWFEGKACDGFVLCGLTMPDGLDKIVKLLVPELQRRGLFHRDYAGSTLRENIGLPIATNAFFKAS